MIEVMLAAKHKLVLLFLFASNTLCMSQVRILLLLQLVQHKLPHTVTFPKKRIGMIQF